MCILLVLNSAIAGGKTELVHVLRQNLTEINGRKVVMIDEPVDLVSNVKGDNLLGKFYKDMSRWAFTLQFFYFIVRVLYAVTIIEHGEEEAKHIMDDDWSLENAKGKGDPNAIYIMERDWYADRTCFAETLHKDGKMTESEWFAYEKIFNWFVTDTPKINGYIFINCCLETHMKRMRVRSRGEETGVTNEYENSLIETHRKMEKDYESSGIPVLSINGELNFKDLGAEQELVVGQIRNFIKKIIE